jgi:hypothetical protein
VRAGSCVREMQGGSGFGSKYQNQAAMAQFQACQVEWQQGTLRRGVVVVCMR